MLLPHSSIFYKCRKLQYVITDSTPKFIPDSTKVPVEYTLRHYAQQSIILCFALTKARHKLGRYT